MIFSDIFLSPKFWVYLFWLLKGILCSSSIEIWLEKMLFITIWKLSIFFFGVFEKLLAADYELNHFLGLIELHLTLKLKLNFYPSRISSWLTNTLIVRNHFWVWKNSRLLNLLLCNRLLQKNGVSFVWHCHICTRLLRFGLWYTFSLFF